MSNDPKDAVVDLLKLMQSNRQTQGTKIIPIIQNNPKANMIKKCNESASLRGKENFTYNDNNNQTKND